MVTQEIYNMNEMVNKEKTEFYLDYDDYINDKVTLSHDDNKGVKVIASKHIFKGELISATKALVAIPSTFDNYQQSFDAMAQKLTEKINKSPMNYSSFFELYDGNNKGQDHKQRVLNQDTSYKKICNVMKHNSFLHQRPILYTVERTFGLWIFPAFFNHSCLSNAFYFDIGDFLLILANKDIQQDEEITITYCSFEIPYQIRKNNLKEAWGIDCNCDLCLYEQHQINTCPEKIELLSYITILYQFLTHTIPVIDNTSIDNLPSFLINNQNLFSDHEKAVAYYLYALYLKSIDQLLALDIFKSTLQYCHNNNPVLERYILNEMGMIYIQTNQQASYNDIKEIIKEQMRVYITKDEEFIEKIIQEALFVIK